MKICVDTQKSNGESLFSYRHVILHIPHAGIETPKEFLGVVCVPDDDLRRNVFKEVDMYIDHLFAMEGVCTLRPSFSRHVCDVERFRDDAKEAESLRGRGLFYTHFESGERFREYDTQLRQRVVTELYDVHHAKLTRVVQNKLLRFGLCRIIDCHSFSDMSGYPDFCIGVDQFHTPKNLYDSLRNLINKAGYTVRINYPYSGSLVPFDHYQKDSRVHSIMIEVNKRLYMDESTFQKKESFADIGQLCQNMIALLS